MCFLLRETISRQRNSLIVLCRMMQVLSADLCWNKTLPTSMERTLIIQKYEWRKGQFYTKRHWYAYSANKKNLLWTSLEYFNSFKALSSRNTWQLFFTDDVVTYDCRRLQAVCCRCRRGMMTIVFHWWCGHLWLSEVAGCLLSLS